MSGKCSSVPVSMRKLIAARKKKQETNRIVNEQQTSIRKAQQRQGGILGSLSSFIHTRYRLYVAKQKQHMLE